MVRHCHSKYRNRSLLLFRFVLDVSMISVFLKQLYYFMMVKLEKLVTESKGLTTFHKLVIIYIIAAVIF